MYSDVKADGTTLLHEPLGGGPYTQAPLEDFRTGEGLSGILGPALDPYLSKLLLVRGLDFLPSVNHNYGGILGNYSSCTAATPCEADALTDIPTIDQVLAYSDKFYPQSPWARQLHVSQGVEDSMSFSDMGTFGGPVQHLKARTNPLDAWNDIFGGFDPNNQGQPDQSRDRLLIDGVLEDYNRLRNHSRLSSADKQSLDQYVTLVTELQARLATTQVLSCTVPVEPESLANNSGTDGGDIERKWELFIDIVAAALMCDQTRIVTMSIHKALGPGPDPSDPTLVGHYHSEDASGGTWHGLAHDWGNENSRRMLAGINRWIADEVFAKLLAAGRGRRRRHHGARQLARVLGQRARLQPHRPQRAVPARRERGRLLEDGAVPRLHRLGRARVLRPGRRDGHRGHPPQPAARDRLQAMGLAPADYERDGTPATARPAPPAARRTLARRLRLRARRRVLPGIRG